MCNLLPELREKILFYCTVGDMKRLSACHSSHRFTFSEMLWQNVKIPWNCLLDDQFMTNRATELQHLQYTKFLTFTTDRTRSRLNESMGEEKDVISLNFLRTVECCDGVILHNFTLQNGVPISESVLRRTFATLFSLHSLTIKHTPLTLSSFNCLGNFEHLVELNLEDMSRCTEVSSSACFFEGLPNLRILNVRKTELNESTFSHLSRLCSLKELNVGNTMISDLSLLLISTSVGLEVLRMGGCSRVTDQGIAHLKNLSNLQTLDVYCCRGITNTATLSLRELVNLRSLNIGFNNISDEGVEILATALPGLRELSISGTEVSTEGVRQISGHLRSLEKLDLRQTLVSDAAIGYLSSLPSLLNLSLQMCSRLTDSGLTHLTTMPRLQVLNIRQVHVGERALKCLSSLKHLKRLKCDPRVAASLTSSKIMVHVHIEC